MQNLNNILIVRTDRIGDVVLTTPAIKAIRQAYPMSRISVLVAPSTAPLVQGNPYIDEVLVDERGGLHRGFIGFLQLCRLIRRHAFDAAIIFHTKRRYNLACFLAGVPVRIGYKNDKFGCLLTHPVKDVRVLGEKHEAAYCLDLLGKIGVRPAGEDLFIPIDAEAERWAEGWMSSYGIHSGELIVIHAGSSDAAKCWPPELFARLIDSLQLRYRFKIVLIGSKETEERSMRIISLAHQKPLNLTGQTSLAQTASLLRRSLVLISNDSGPVHLGAAAGIYVISLFMRDQPGINPERWKPLSDKGICLFSPQGLKVDDVLEAIEKIFQKDFQKFFHW